jgi:hypothetical protein
LIASSAQGFSFGWLVPARLDPVLLHHAALKKLLTKELPFFPPFAAPVDGWFLFLSWLMAQVVLGTLCCPSSSMGSSILPICYVTVTVISPATKSIGTVEAHSSSQPLFLLFLLASKYQAIWTRFSSFLFSLA